MILLSSCLRHKLYLKMQRMCLYEEPHMMHHIWTNSLEVATVRNPSKLVEMTMRWFQATIDQLECHMEELAQVAVVDQTFTATCLDRTLIQFDPVWVSSPWIGKNTSRPNIQMSTTVHLQCKSSEMKKPSKTETSVKQLFLKKKDKIILIKFNQTPVCWLKLEVIYIKVLSHQLKDYRAQEKWDKK